MKRFYFFFTFLCCLFLGFQPDTLQAQSDQYLHFDREDDYVRLDNGSSYVANANGISMTGWFYTDALEYGQGMIGLRGANSGFYLIQLNDGTLECRFLNSTGTLFEYVAPAFSVLPETWQHFAWVYTGSRIKLYINGIEQGSSFAGGRITNTEIPFTIGRSILGDLNFYFGGRADEVTLWSRALEDSEIHSMIAGELEGNEDGLELYYKFNQGLPGEDNTSISKLKCEVGDGERDADLVGFALNGEDSNFGGELDLGFQAITFPQIPNKLTVDAPFEIQAAASSNLPVSFSIAEGPATIEGNMVTLTGTSGTVKIQASQEGNGEFDAAETLVNTFVVIDPAENVPIIDIRTPTSGIVYAPDVTPIQLAAIVDIEYRELFDINSVQFVINDEIILPTDWRNGHYSAWWMPPAHGNYTFRVVALNNYFNAAVESVDFNIVNQASDMNDLIAFEDILLNTSVSSEVVQAKLPSYVGAFDKITAKLEVKCPPGGCGEWDRVASVDVKGHNGEWVEIIRYITPYGVACSSEIDLTDYNSILNGEVAFRVNCGTFDNGYLYDLILDFRQGTPLHNYSKIDVLWQESFPFGDPANLQPVPDKTVDFDNNIFGAKLKLVSTGHGWGENNTDNAAEFHEDTHHIWVNGEQAFTQHNWAICNPNPDGCSPQNGTWFHNRAGWCPGAIAPWFDFDFTPFILNDEVTLQYIFDEDYVDNCHPNNPDCVSNPVSCPNCEDGFNPELIVAANFITFSSMPIDGAATFSTDIDQYYNLDFEVFPNPSTGVFALTLEETASDLDIRVFNNMGQVVAQFEENNRNRNRNKYTLNLNGHPKGIYLVEVRTNQGTGLKKVIVE